jgi:hypothetical protein
VHEAFVADGGIPGRRRFRLLARNPASQPLDQLGRLVEQEDRAARNGGVAPAIASSTKAPMRPKSPASPDRDLSEDAPTTRHA